MLNKKHVPNSSAGEQAIIAGVRRLGTVDYIGGWLTHGRLLRLRHCNPSTNPNTNSNPNLIIYSESQRTPVS